MRRPAHPHAMQPARAGRTRTAPPALPDRYPFAGRYLAYTLFDLTGLLYLMIGFAVLRAVWALGSGPEAWQVLREQYANPLYVGFHLLTLVSVCFVAVRFFRLFPKAQPPRIGPLKPPPGPLIHAMLYVVWLGVTLVFATILAGGLF